MSKLQVTLLSGVAIAAATCFAPPQANASTVEYTVNDVMATLQCELNCGLAFSPFISVTINGSFDYNQLPTNDIRNISLPVAENSINGPPLESGTFTNAGPANSSTITASYDSASIELDIAFLISYPGYPSYGTIQNILYSYTGSYSCLFIACTYDLFGALQSGSITAVATPLPPSFLMLLAGLVAMGLLGVGGAPPKIAPAHATASQNI